MPTDEETYLQLKARFNEELTLVEQQIIDLQDRRDQLVNLLNAAGPSTVVFTPEEEPLSVEDLVGANRRRERTEGRNAAAKAEIDKDLVEFVQANPDSSRALINKGLAVQGWSSWDVDKSLKRCKNAGKIVRKGNTRTATWSAK